jgi:hypothetical protein
VGFTADGHRGRSPGSASFRGLMGNRAKSGRIWEPARRLCEIRIDSQQISLRFGHRADPFLLQQLFRSWYCGRAHRRAWGACGRVHAIVHVIGGPVEEEQGVLLTDGEGLEGVELLPRAEDLLVYSLHARTMS